MARYAAVENDYVWDHDPTHAEKLRVLSEVPAWHGSTVTMADYIGFVIGMKQKGSTNQPGDKYRLYTTCAGKIAILRDAHRLGDGTIISLIEDIHLEWKGNLVIVQGTLTSPTYGTVYEVATGVVGEGARGADQTSPYENAMTSWRGRAASALVGAGVLPYTGIASAEEVRTAADREEAAESGMRVIRAGDETEKATKQVPAAMPSETVDRILKGQKDQWKLKDEEFNDLLSGYLKKLEIDPGDDAYETARGALTTSTVGGLLKYIKDNRKSV